MELLERQFHPGIFINEFQLKTSTNFINFSLIKRDC